MLAVAVAALAQPLWRDGGGATSTSVARVIVIDTQPSRGDDVARDAIERQVLGLESESGITLRVPANAPHEALQGAVEWLRTQRGRGELIVLSDFRRGALDSLDLTALPSDIAVRLMRVPASVATRARVDHRVVRWAHALAASRADRLGSVVRELGGVALAERATGVSNDSAAQVVVVASPGADSLPAWVATARPLSAPWMGDVVYALRGDTTVATASAETVVPNLSVESPAVVVLRDANQSPLVTASTIVNAAGNARLLLKSRAPAEALITTALLLSVSQSSRIDQAVTQTPSTPTDDQLRRWERAPAAPITLRNSSRQGNADEGPSDGRWLWLVGVLLLGVESVMRRRIVHARSESITVSSAGG
ncbi:MAG: hypothetical protein ABMA00_19945, partial [Gemmatimonas sp.]